MASITASVTIPSEMAEDVISTIQEERPRPPDMSDTEYLTYVIERLVEVEYNRGKIEQMKNATKAVKIF